MKPALENANWRVQNNAEAKENGFIDEDYEKKSGLLRRRAAIISGFSLVSAVLGFAGDGLAVKQGLLAGRIPGLSEPDEKGWFAYIRIPSDFFCLNLIPNFNPLILPILFFFIYFEPGFSFI